MEVLGQDLSENMVNIAMERAITEKLPSVRLKLPLTWSLLTWWFFFSWTQIPRVLSQVQFEVADATKRMFPECSFDVIYSRDSILHIDNKPALFKRFHVSISAIRGTVIQVFIFKDISVNGKFSFSLLPVMAKTRWPVTDHWLLLWGKTLDASFWDLCQTERLHSIHTFTVRQGTGNTPQYKLSSSLS